MGVVYSHAARPSLPTRPISLILDIGQGAGLAGATGVRPFLPPLLAGALARADAGIDFEGGGYGFLESPGFLLAVLALAVASYAADRAAAGRRPPGGRDPAARKPPRGAIEVLLTGAAIALGALLFAGALSGAEREAWPGLLAGAACAALGYVAVATFFDRARRRVEGTTATLLTAYADLIALLLAALAIFVAPAAFVALAAFAFVAVRSRGQGERKFAGLRILR